MYMGVVGDSVWIVPPWSGRLDRGRRDPEVVRHMIRRPDMMCGKRRELFVSPRAAHTEVLAASTRAASTCMARVLQ